MSEQTSSQNGVASEQSSVGGFERFVQRLQDTTPFFEDLREGTPEYDERLSIARAKYNAFVTKKKQTRTPTQQSSPSPALASPQQGQQTRSQPSPGSPVGPSEEDKRRAQQMKERGNAQLKAKHYEGALTSYSECIKLDGTNAVYYSNRAAAKLLLSRFSEAVDDCKHAIRLDGAFVRPRERLASAYRYLGMPRQEVDALKGALALAPNNQAFQMQLRDAELRLSQSAATSAAGGAGGATPLGGAAAPGMDANMLGMMARSMGVNIPDGMAEMVANSDIMNQVGNVARNNPRMVEQMMQMMSGGGLGGSSGAGNGTGNGAGNGAGSG